MAKSFAAVLALFVIVSSACSSGWKEPKTYTFKTATGAEQYERLFWDAVKNKDRLAVSSHLASNFVRQDESGTKNKEQYLAELNQMTLTDYSLAEVNVTPQGIDMIVTYSITLRGSTGGKPFPNEPVRYMSVWQQHNTGWVLVAQSAMQTRQ